MARLISSYYAPRLGINIITSLANGSEDVKKYHIDDIIDSIRYLDNGEVKTVGGRLAEINYNNGLFDHAYNNLANLRSYFADDVKATTIVIDNSTENHSSLVEIPVREIIEDAGVAATRVKTEMTLGCFFSANLTDDTEVSTIVSEGDDIKNLTYMTRSGDVTSDVKVIAFKYSGNLQPTAMVVVENGRVKIIDFITVKGIDGVAIPVDASMDLSTVLADDEDGYVSILAGENTTALNITKDAVIRGAKAGIPALVRVENDLEGETVLSGKITVTDGVDVTLDGVVLTGDAYLIFKNNPNVTLQNVVVKNLSASNGTNSFPLLINKGNPTKLTITNCYFGNNGEEKSVMKNGFELNTPLADGTLIANNYFEKNVARNNIVCLYDIEDGATVTVANNHFEYSANGVRVATKGNKEVTVNVLNNRYDETYTADPGYAGLLLIQPYNMETESFAKNVIIINGTIRNDDGQLWYLYDAGANDQKILPSMRPTVIVDGVVEMEPTAE